MISTQGWQLKTEEHFRQDGDFDVVVEVVGKHFWLVTIEAMKGEWIRRVYLVRSDGRYSYDNIDDMGGESALRALAVRRIAVRIANELTGQKPVYVCYL